MQTFSLWRESADVQCVLVFLLYTARFAIVGNVAKFVSREKSHSPFACHQNTSCSNFFKDMLDLHSLQAILEFIMKSDLAVVH